MNPVSRMTSRISVKVVPLNELNRLVPSAHFTFLLAGSFPAARASAPAKTANEARRVILHLESECISQSCRIVLLISQPGVESQRKGCRVKKGFDTETRRNKN